MSGPASSSFPSPGPGSVRSSSGHWFEPMGRYAQPRMPRAHKSLTVHRGQGRAQKPTLLQPHPENTKAGLSGPAFDMALERDDCSPDSPPVHTQQPPLTPRQMQPQTHPGEKAILSPGKHSRNTTWELGGVREPLKAPLFPRTRRSSANPGRVGKEEEIKGGCDPTGR